MKTRSLFSPLLCLLAIVGAVVGLRAASAEAGTAKGVIRIKAGVDQPMKDELGNVWQQDQGFEGGDVVSREPTLAIANTKTPSLYRSEHYSMTRFSQKLANGKYTVKLHFAETFEDINAAGQRVFSFNVQGKDFKDFDVFVKAGGANRAYVETVAVEITDGKLDVTFTPKVENPEVNAIEIIPSS